MSHVARQRWTVFGLIALFLFATLPTAAEKALPTPTPQLEEGEPLKDQPLQGVPMNRPDRGMVYDGLEAAQLGPCVGLFEIGQTDICTHGPDEAPPGTNIFLSAEPVQADRMATNAIICEGDGVSGKRTQIMYVRASDRPDRYSTYLASFRSWSADMDAIYNASAAETGGVRHLRFVTDSGCNISVLNIVVSPTGDDTFNNTINEVSNMGYRSTNRKYLMFVDANVYCGIGGIQNDDRAIATNYNNTTTSYGRVDAGCWGGPTAAHENMHNLGGVQNSAPNTTRGWHCTDEYDLLCYSDSPYYPQMRIVCGNQAHNNRFDCNHDDFYHTNPPAGSYLATHWNTAFSAFLIQSGSGTPTPTPTTPPTGNNVIVNGGFENGSAPWVQNTNGGNLISNAKPRTGTYGLYFGGFNQANEKIYQTVTVPANGTLSYSYYITTQETYNAAYDYLRVRVYNTSGTLLATLKTYSNLSTKNTWVTDSVSISAYAGQTVRIQFESITDASLYSSFYVDDVKTQ